ncbi:RNA polymerase factor sigma-70 [Posidoniimonas corsicana]|uniref:RNA polymerase factor sigma-70 n=1 Tax=Posidoniimonas corsicana TaxID=1938618 RepID=A0A5C5VEV9_9BACT|nr:RNA polymerase sigma factor [Posidoniimonas corsicana]TWT37186.1 RNA polymerase factor sigma-70 [Posidoniimonas corsicana]
MNPTVEEPPDEVDIALRLLEGDQSCLADLIRLTAPIEEAIRGRFPSLAADAEDIVAEAVRRLWKARANFDPDRPLRPYLYRIAERVGLDYVEGRLRWLAMRAKEVAWETEQLAVVPPPYCEELAAEDVAPAPSKKLLRDVREAVDGLKNPLHKAVLVAYAEAGDYVLDAGLLGQRLGEEHNGGVPIPAGTIRQYKHRAKSAVEAELRRQGHNVDLLVRVI